jgi:hypothetical protein
MSDSLTAWGKRADGVPSQDVGQGTVAGRVIAAGQTARVLNDVVEAIPDGGTTILMLGSALVVLSGLGHGMSRRKG